MKELEQYRNKINDIDKKMARLFCERMAQVKNVALYKKERGLNVFDQGRENEVIEKNLGYIDDMVLKSYYISFIKSTMEISKQYQHLFLDGIKIACSGAEGAFAHIAAKRIFPKGSCLFFRDFASAYKSVEDGSCSCCVLPIENSYAGEVTQVTDLIYSGSLYINGIYDLEICHNLLGVDGAEIGDIKTVLSHPQALSQCQEYIHEHGFKSVAQENTAVSARYVSEREDRTIAAIASSETAKLYKLKILDHDINSSSTNTTRFAVFSRVESISDNPKSRFIMIFTVHNEAKALARAINIIGEYGFNMRVLRSRPVKEEPWKYYFYVEAEGNAYDENAERMFTELSFQCDMVKLAGSFLNEEKI